MSEGSGGHHDRAHQAVPKSQSRESGPLWKKALRRATLAAAGLAAIGGGVKVADQVFRPPVESLESQQASISFINTGEYFIVPHLEGGEDLLFRRDVDLKDPPSYNAFQHSDIAEVNGVPWDGKSPLWMKNIPVHFEGDRHTGQGANPIFMAELGVKSLLGEIVTTVGYIDQGEAPAGRVFQITKGEIAKIGTDKDGKVIGVLESGEKISNSEIGMTRIAATSTTTKVGNPK